MKIRTFIITFLLLLSASLTAHAEDGNITDTNATGTEILLFEMINDLRARPVQVIAENGFQADTLTSNIPEMAGILSEGLTPLDMNEALNASSQAHLNDMREKGFYSEESLDGRLPYDRMIEAGYLPAESEEVIAMLGFRNFIDDVEAVHIIFSKILEEELSKSSINDLTILSPELEDIGIAFDAATIPSGSIYFNSYLTVCDLGDHLLSEVEQEIFTEINRIRRDPETYAAETGVDLEELYRQNPELRDLLTTEISSLTINETLYEAAGQRSLDILADNTTWPDQEMVMELLAANGEESVRAEERVRMQITIDLNQPSSAARENLARIFLKDLQVHEEKRFLLHPAYNLVGLRVIVRKPGEWIEPGGEVSSYHVILLEIIMGEEIQVPDLEAET